MPSSPPEPSSRLRGPLRTLLTAGAWVAVAAGALFVGAHLLLVVGFWLKPSVRPGEEEEESAPVPSVWLDPGTVAGGWPLTVPADSLYCYPDGAIALMTAEPYAVNAEARPYGFRPLEEVARGRPASLAPLRRRAEELCRGARP